MDRETMRSRGWSIHSSEHGGEDAKEDDLSQHEKLALLNSYPTVVDEDDHHHAAPSTTTTTTTTTHVTFDVVDLADSPASASQDNTKCSNDGSDANQNDDYMAMFGDDEDEEEAPNHQLPTGPPARKRRRIDPTDASTSTNEVNTTLSREAAAATATADKEQKRMLALAKAKLSKWAARLFDPDRPRGLVEAPATIPLNDEFLTAFGKREKKHDEQTGRDIDIDKTNLDEDVDEIVIVESKDKKSKSLENCKVKILNLAYTTTEKGLTTKSQIFGALAEANLIMNSETSRSTGRAYVTFETPEAAAKCIEGMNDKAFEGRILRVMMANADPDRRRSTGNQGSKNVARYWERDISTKCFRCGKIGHMSSSCTNAPKASPCTFCAMPGHDTWSCPMSKICFNCGVPGHINRECSQPRGLPKRMVCGICFQSGHHRWMCREQPHTIPTRDAICMVCCQKGHYMCSEMRWFFGLDGLTCFNCGQAGHHGIHCERPGLDVCARDSGVATNEIDRADEYALVSEMESQKQKNNGGSHRNVQESRGRNNVRRQDSFHESRSRSQPPPGDYRMQYQATQGGGQQRDRGHLSGPRPGGSRGYSVPPQQQQQQHRQQQQQQHHRNHHNGNAPNRNRRISDPRNNNRRGYH